MGDGVSEDGGSEVVMFAEIEFERTNPNRPPLKCFVHASVTLLVRDHDDLNSLVSMVYALLTGEYVDGAVVVTDWGRILVRNHGNGGLSFYAATTPQHRGRFIEAASRTRLDRIMLDHGFIPCPPVIDTGIDCVYYRDVDGELRLVQLKQRVGIWKKYQDRTIWIAFPEDRRWYVYPHDELVALCEAEGKWLKTASWKNQGHYHAAKVPAWMWPWMAQWMMPLC